MQSQLAKFSFSSLTRLFRGNTWLRWLIIFSVLGLSAISYRLINRFPLIYLVGGIGAIIIGLFEATAWVRFARTGSIGEAFNFGAILAHIGKIGWGSYILALIVLVLIVGIIEVIISAIPAVGGILLIILAPAILLFWSRYLSLLYDSAGSTP